LPTYNQSDFRGDFQSKTLLRLYARIDPEKRALEEENERLKKIIARQALELEVKSELLKKRECSTNCVSSQN